MESLVKEYHWRMGGLWDAGLPPDPWGDEELDQETDRMNSVAEQEA